jgi:hypothetical protein
VLNRIDTDATKTFASISGAVLVICSHCSRQVRERSVSARRLTTSGARTKFHSRTIVATRHRHDHIPIIRKMQP